MAVQQRAWRRGLSAIITFVATLVLAVAAPHQAPTPNRESFDDRYRRGREATAGLKTLTAHFTEVTTSSLLTRPLVAHGTLAVERPARVILRYTEPDRRIVLIEGDRMTMTWPSRNLRQVSDIRRARERVQRYFVDGTAAELRREFDIESREASERPGTDEVRLRPKRRQIRETLSRVDVWVDPGTALPAALRMTFANGDTKTMTFERVIANPVLAADAFSAGE